MSRGPAAQLSRTDLRAILAFLSDVRDLEFELPYPPEFVARLGDLVPAAHVVYRENDLRQRRTPRMVDAEGAHPDDADELYWTVGPDPITQYRSRTHDLSSARLSDIVAWRQYRETPTYGEYFGPGMVDHMLDLGLQISTGWQRSFLFCRARGERDYAERDRAVLETLRPHLEAFEAEATLRRQLAQLIRGTDANPAVPWSAGDPSTEPDPPNLTTREREIVALVAHGMTNAEIAAELWVTPGTVKKHLEHVYAKLGVGRRAAVATIARAGAITSEIGLTVAAR